MQQPGLQNRAPVGDGVVPQTAALPVPNVACWSYKTVAGSSECRSRASKTVKAGRGHSTDEDDGVCVDNVAFWSCKKVTPCSSRASKTVRPPVPNPMRVKAGRGHPRTANLDCYGFSAMILFCAPFGKDSNSTALGLLGASK